MNLKMNMKNIILEEGECFYCRAFSIRLDLSLYRPSVKMQVSKLPVELPLVHERQEGGKGHGEEAGERRMRGWRQRTVARGPIAHRKLIMYIAIASNSLQPTSEGPPVTGPAQGSSQLRNEDGEFPFQQGYDAMCRETKYS